MSSEVIALIASVSYALFTLYGWFGLRHSTALVAATIVSSAARTITGTVAVFTVKVAIALGRSKLA